MNIDLKITLIGLFAAAIGGAFGAGTTVWLTHKQLRATYDTLRLDILQKKTEKIETAYQTISTIRIDLTDPTLMPEEIRARAIDCFASQVSAFKPCAHYFPKELAEDLYSLQHSINQCITECKLGQTLNLDRAKHVFAAIPNSQKRLLEAMEHELRDLQMQIRILVGQTD